MLCFNKLIGENNAKKYFENFLFCGSISLSSVENFEGIVKMYRFYIQNSGTFLYFYATTNESNGTI